jgi:hypothetical protein
LQNLHHSSAVCKGIDYGSSLDRAFRGWQNFTAR